jgi:PadR family transcriptional regulator, regulatory protein PadR
MKKDVTKGNLDLLLLSVISRAPGHGYAVITALREQSGGAFDLPEGSIYPALHRLEDLGLLASEWESASGRRRRVYRLTKRGSQALERERRHWQSLATAVNAVVDMPARVMPARVAVVR